MSAEPTTRDKEKVEGGDIAIVGMACLFPGAPDLRTFWQNILDKVDAVSDPPDDWGGQYSYDPDSSESDRIYCQRGGYLGELARFDPLEYGIMPKAVDGAEPEHFLALRVASDALKDAGFPDIPINRDRTEVILGRGTYVNRALMNLHQHGFVIHQTLALLKELHPEYTDDLLAELKRKLKEKLPPFDALTAAGVVSSIMSGRIANRLDLKGSNYCLDAACASSLIAVEHAVRDLRLGKCDAVIAGGVQLSANNLVLMVFSQLGALSRRAEMRPFDAGADGTLLGEGVGMVVLKRREDAERDGSRIYANIKGVGSASDGRAKSIVAPRVEGEELALRRAYDAAGVSPGTIGLVEAHGTSIPLGDAAEIETLSRVFGSRDGPSARCGIGSVKSMIGHLIPAAGMAGLIKTALALYHGTLPPTLHCEEPDPRIELEKTPFYINTETRPWIHASSSGVPRRAGVSAFGFGGINAHAVLEENPVLDEAESDSHYHDWDTELCVVSEESRQALIKRIEAIHAFLSASSGVALKDVAHTINSGLAAQPYRLAVVCHSVEELSRKLTHSLNRLKDASCTRIKDRSGIFFFEERLAKKGKVAFMFPGEGSQYTNMLADLCIHFPEVRRVFDMTDRAFLEAGSRYLLSQILFPPPTGLSEADHEQREELLWQMEAGGQAVTTANRALDRLLRRLEIRPDVVVGHSSGEFGSLEAAGAIELEMTEDFIQYLLAGKNSVRGVSEAAEALDDAVLVVVSPEDPSIVSRIVKASKGDLLVAMHNCSRQVVICGSARAAQSAIEELHAAGVSCSTLPFRRPYHTPAFEPACAPLIDFFGSLKIVQPKVPMYSCATAALFPDEPEAIRSLAVAQWTLPIRFQETIDAMYEAGVRIFVEIGPKQNLTAFVSDILRDRPFLAVPTNVQHKSGIAQLHYALGMLAAQGVEMKLDFLYSRRSPKLLEFDTSLKPDGNGAAKEMPRLSLTLPMVYLNREDLAGIKIQPVVCDAESPRAPTQTDPIVEPPSRSAAMNEYFSTMEQFLQSQQQVMTAYFNKRSVQEKTRLSGPRPRSDQPANVPQNGQPTTASIAVHPQVTQTVAPRPNRPFAGTIVRQVPGQEVVIRRDLDLEEDLFLKHHVLGGKVSMLDETLEPLPVMPLTMSMEMIGEAAVCLVPDKVLVGMRNVRAHRWIVVEDQRVGLQMAAKRLNGEEVYVEMREAGPENTALGPPIIEGTMILADAYPTPPAVGGFHLKGARASRFAPGTLYTTGMFNGPSFQAVCSVDQWAEDGSIATFQALPADRLFRSIRDPAFVIDPVLLDAAGQQAAHWNAEASSSGFNFFPYRFEELRVYAPPLVAPARAQSQLRIESVGQGQYRSDIRLIGPDGQTRFQLIGWEDREFPLPKAFYGIRHGSPEIEVGVAWPVPLGMVSNRQAYECRRVDEFSKELLLGHGKIWLKVLAYQILSRRERSIWHTSQMSDTRCLQWLLGRAAAKEAVRTLLARRAGLDLCPADIEIEADENGRPYVIGERIPGLERGPAISIAHTDEIAVAIAVDGGEGADIGIDVERLRELNEDFADITFRPEEQELLSTISGAGANECVLRCWCAKEAVAKALGIGLRGQPQNYVVREYNTDNGAVELEIAREPACLRPSLDGVRVRALTVVENDLVVGVAVHARS